MGRTEEERKNRAPLEMTVPGSLGKRATRLAHLPSRGENPREISRSARNDGCEMGRTEEERKNRAPLEMTVCCYRDGVLLP